MAKDVAVDRVVLEVGDIVQLDEDRTKFYRITRVCPEGYHLEEVDEKGELKKALKDMEYPD